MKILFIASDNNRSSGAFLSMTALNIYLNKEFHVETKVILPREGTGEQLLFEGGVPSQIIRSYDWIIPQDTVKTPLFRLKHFIKSLMNIRAANKIAKIAVREKYDIIHINTLYSYVGALAAKKAGIPYVWHMREILEGGQNRTFIDKKGSYSLIGQSDCIMAISMSVFRNYCFKINCQNMRIVYNGIDEARFYRPNKKIFQDDFVRILFVGGFNKNKGAFTICDALSRIVSRFNNVEIWFVGEPTEKFKQYVKSLGLTPYTRFWGYQKDVENFYEKSDITLTGGKMEAFGRTTAEAMLCGNLVISTDSAGSKELVFDHQTGLSYKFGNTDELAKKIEYALSNKKLMREIAKNGQNFIKNEMTAYINAKHIYSHYERIMYKRRNPNC